MDLHRLPLLVAVPHAVFGVLEVVHDQPDVFVDAVDWVTEGAFAVAMALAAVALAALARAVTGGARAAFAVAAAGSTAMALAAVALAALARAVTGGARAAFAVAAAGSAAVALAATATAVAGENVLGLGIALGLLASLLGQLAAAVLDLRGRVEPPRAGLVLFGALLASVVVERTGAGGLVLAAGWLAVAALVAERRQPALA